VGQAKRGRTNSRDQLVERNACTKNDGTSMVSNANTKTSLLERLCEGGDPMVWDDFFSRYWPFVFSVARQHGCSEHTGEEIVQEVMLAIFEKKAVFCHDPARGRFRDWLGGVVRNKVVVRRRSPADRCRARGGCDDDLPEIEAPRAEPSAQWNAAFDQAMLAFLLDKVRSQVHPRTYQAFEAVALGGCSAAEAARLTGLTPNAVYQARKNILKRLRELGAVYGQNGPPDDMIRAALRSRPGPAVERSLTMRIERTARGYAMSDGESSLHLATS
jgi:RNA polymerase sigma factor (sigma-70 family)